MRYPWYSVDSATWVFTAGMGWFNKFENGKYKTYHYRNKKDVIKAGGMTYVDNNSVRFNARRACNVKTFLEMEKYLNDLWEKRGVKWED